MVPIQLPPPGHPAWARAGEIADALKAAGKGNAFVAAALANAYAESAWTAVVEGDHDQSFGPWQINWRYVGTVILDATNVDIRSEPSLAEHCRALLWLLHTTPYLSVEAALDAAPTAAEATRIFCAEFERAGAADAVGRRVAIAPAIDVWLAKRLAAAQA